MSTLHHSNLLSANPDGNPAVIVPGQSGFAISCSELVQQCDNIQRQLSSLGLGPGTAVSLSLPNSVDFVVIFLATTWQRCIAAPLNPAYKEDEADFYISDIDAAAIIVPRDAYKRDSPAVLAAKKRNAAVLECWTDEKGFVVLEVKEKARLQGAKESPVEHAQEEDVALVLHTSGTTGKPKAVRAIRKILESKS